MQTSMLPLDILYCIIGHIDCQQDLALVSLTSPTFRLEAQRLLFRDPGPLILGLQPGKLHNSFLDAIIASPDRLALTVRVFGFYFGWDVDYTQPSPESNGETIDSILDKTEQALRLARNIRELRIYEVSATARGRRGVLRNLSRALAARLPECSSRLSAFTWLHMPIRATEELIMTEFLPRQPDIKDLMLRTTDYPLLLDFESYESDTDVCPGLESLSGAAVFLARVLRHRRASLKFCHMDLECAHLLHPWVAHLSPGLSTVQLLDYHFSYRESHLITTLALKLRSLVVLRISIGPGDDGWHEVFHPSVLHSLPQLQILVWTFSDWVPNETKVANTARLAFSRSQSLRYVDLQIGHITFRHIRNAELRLGVNPQILLDPTTQYSWDNRRRFLEWALSTSP